MVGGDRSVCEVPVGELLWFPQTCFEMGALGGGVYSAYMFKYENVHKHKHIHIQIHIHLHKHRHIHTHSPRVLPYFKHYCLKKGTPSSYPQNWHLVRAKTRYQPHVASDLNHWYRTYTTNSKHSYHTKNPQKARKLSHSSNRQSSS